MPETERKQKRIPLDKIAIDIKSHRLLAKLLEENPPLSDLMHNAVNKTEALIGIREWILEELEESPDALAFYRSKRHDSQLYQRLKWSDLAAIRLLDYVDNAGREFADPNLHGELAVSDPIHLIWLAVNHGTGGAKPHFFLDMLELFRQLRGENEPEITAPEQGREWMGRWPSGLDLRIVKLREENRDRILSILLQKMDAGEIRHHRFQFDPGMTEPQKRLQLLKWWQDKIFHLTFAVRSPDLLNELLGNSLDPDTLAILHRAEQRGIPFFVNPYYLSLLHVRVPHFAIGADLAIRHYVLYSEQLVEEFGDIVGWEKEDLVEPGRPNAAGWILPTVDSIHRRYPNVAILIPDTQGRACGGLCASCQRMYDFQRGHLNFDLKALEPKESWPDKLRRLMDYFEQDAQLRDILITGGDALMNSDRSLERLFDAIIAMAERKREANEARANGKKYAEILRIRLGTRLPIYLPQRITPKLIQILADFRRRARRVGIKQFVIQTHFESPMEITPESRLAIEQLVSAGWMVANQLVFTVAASRRGHTARLRQALNDIGVLCYYSFVVKGYQENNSSFAPIARLIQEEREEKQIGTVSAQAQRELIELCKEPERLKERLAAFRERHGIPFISSDRSVLNLPAVGKSLTFRVIGITRYGRRIVEFDHDPTRAHSPIIKQMGKVVIIESKAIAEYLEQLDRLGEDPMEYRTLYGYSLGETEPRFPIFKYPDYGFTITDELTHFELVDPE